ncbi:uncharacterized protein LOC122223806 isoform X5 [Panthera leo]|uniref:uncharacterized protein LOC122223806 isoform X5 n=1 Tax=Panthera leo TaxID=9689 RepID=UPI001C69C02F|nr:uncharacterized protein LOC122223806 isoform X5 [Panthera leo]
MTPVNQEGGLTRHGICQHLHLRLAAPRTVRKKCLLFSPRLWCSVTAARAKTLRWFLLPSLLKDVSSYTDFLVHGHFFPSTSVIPRQLSAARESWLEIQRSRWEVGPRMHHRRL